MHSKQILSNILHLDTQFASRDGHYLPLFQILKNTLWMKSFCWSCKHGLLNQVCKNLLCLKLGNLKHYDNIYGLWFHVKSIKYKMIIGSIYISLAFLLNFIKNTLSPVSSLNIMYNGINVYLKCCLFLYK